MKKLFILLTLLCMIGGGKMWAETIVFDFTDANGNLLGTAQKASGGNATTVTSSPITLTFQSSSSRSVNVNTTSKQIKFEGKSGDYPGSSLIVSTSSSSIYITAIVVVSSGNYVKNFTASTGNYTYTTSSPSTGTWDNNNENVTSVNFNTDNGNVDQVTSISVTYTDNRTTLTQYEFNSDEVICHGTSNVYVNGTTFVYDSNNATLKTKVKLNPVLSTIGADASTSYFTVSSSDNTILDATGTITVSSANNGSRLYFDGITVKKAGTATLTYNFLGTDTYKPTSFTQQITVVDPIDTYDGTYKYTWDFANGDWTTSVLQLNYGYSAWTVTNTENATEARPTSVTSISADSGIDIIKGLSFTTPSAGSLCLDWYTGRKGIWLASGSTVTIPDLVEGQTITITADGTNYTASSNATLSSNVARVNSDGSVTLTMTGDTRIYSISVTNKTYGWTYTTTTETLGGVSRPVKGTYTFTADGPLEGGTVIDEVPGITMTIGASGDNWEVVDATAIDGSYNLGAAAAYCNGGAVRPYWNGGCFYKFEPVVNGELTVKFYSVKDMYLAEGLVSGGKVNTTTRIQELSFMFEAGKTYYFGSKDGGFHLNSFSYRPVFFNPGTTTDQLTIGNFTARIGNPTIDAFPKLIDRTNSDQANRVKFAGDKTKVYLYKNNDVEIIGAGTNILIRGTVLNKNNEDGLVAYYYLNSYLLTVSEYELDDQAYIATNGLTDDKYQFTFSGEIQAVNSGNLTVQVQKDGGTAENVTATISGAILYVPFSTLEAGATYRMIIPENTLALTADAQTKNSKIERVFSVNADGEAQVKLVYPTGLATVGTAIVLDTYINGSSTNVIVNNSKKVKGILSDGTNEMVLDARFGTNQVVFKPTTTLLPNTTYTLTIPVTYEGSDNKIYLNNTYESTNYMVTHQKTFTFTTGSSSGTAPVVVDNGTFPAEGQTLDAATYYNSGRISFTFDQTIELEPYSEVLATPINGSEATAKGETNSPEATNNTLLIDSDGKTVYFNYSADDLKYDLYYQVVIPANTVIGAGGLPNATPITLTFRMGMNPNATAVDAATFYPHTWDFCKLGDTATEGTTAYNITNGCGDHGSDYRVNSLYQATENGYTTYKTKGQPGYGYDQGNDVYFHYKLSGGSATKEVMDEFAGIRVSLVNSRSNRFEIRNETSANSSRKNLDGTDVWSFRMIGNTHYLTLSNVPAGELYMVVNAPHLGINSPNATFTSVSGSGHTLSNENTLLKTNGTKRVKLNVSEAGDVVFCVQNLSLEKIGVAVAHKKALSSYDNFFTDCQDKPMRYELTNSFSGQSVTAYYVDSSTGYTSGSSTITLTPFNVASANEGVILKANESSDDVPTFAADVNSSADSHSTALVGVLESTVVTATDGDYRNYAFTNLAGKVNEEGEAISAFKTTSLGFYRAMKSSTLGANKCYLQLPKSLVDDTSTGNAKSCIFIDLLSWEDVASGVERVAAEPVREFGTDVYYTLDGFRLSGKPAKSGLYIVNGKKVYINK